MDFRTENPQRLAAAWARFDEENARDPNGVTAAGRRQPRELAYAQWLTDWVLRLDPAAPEVLRLAARCQHLRRWEIPRESYPMTRLGYLAWREALKQFHASRAGEILREVGYPEEIVQRVQNLNLKRNFPAEPASRVLEDALCLVFLEHQLPELIQKTSEEKILQVLQKTWKKMTPAGRAAALALALGSRERAALDRALGSELKA
jgi:hypothetical protein